MFLCIYRILQCNCFGFFTLFPLHPRLQGATFSAGVFKEAATKGSEKLRRKKGRGQDSEENSSNLERD